jgi:molybdopterin-guanine dinucleotide biosynthesis protein B
MPPIISIVGKKKSGKTTLIERLIAELKSRGYRIGTVKHHIHYGFSMDEPGKDTWRHFAAGADTVIISSPDRLVITKNIEKEYLLKNLVSEYLDSEDFVLTEGYTKADTPKIAVVKSEEDLKLFSKKNLIAVVSDGIVKSDAPLFKFEDIKELADLIEGYKNG